MTAGKYDHIKQLIKDGKRAEAQAELAAMVRADPADADAWYGLAQVVDDQEKKRYCLEKAQKLRPEARVITEELRRASAPTVNMQLPNVGAPTNSKKKKTAWWVWALLAVSVPILACMCFGMLSAAVGDVTDNIDPSTVGTSEPVDSKPAINPFSVDHKIVYRVEGSASAAMITYSNAQGGTEQLNSARLPWRANYTLENGEFASLVAQSGETGRTISCIIEIDGREWKRSTSKGDYVVVTCTGWVGME